VAISPERVGTILGPAENALIGSFYASYLAGAAVPHDWPQRAVELIPMRWWTDKN
jgi:hypothetical protein